MHAVEIIICMLYFWNNSKNKKYNCYNNNYEGDGVGHRKVIENYYNDVNNLADLLGKLVNSYRLLVGSAHELNGIAISHRSDVKDALDRVDELGDVIDDVLDTLKYVGCSYMDYCKLKSEVIKNQMETQYILTEIDNELKLKE